MKLLVVVSSDAEGVAGAEWAREKKRCEVQVASAPSMAQRAEGMDAVWIHGDNEPALSAESIAALRSWIAKGGGVVLSLGAVGLSAQLGLESDARMVRESRNWSDDADPLWDASFRNWPDYPHIRGLQGWPAGSHPLFDGFEHGTFTWAASHGETYHSSTYSKPEWPDWSARVVAVERAYVQLNSDVAVAWEYEEGAGRVLCLGAHVRFSAPDKRFVAQLDRLMSNAIEDACRTTRNQSAGERASWPEAQDRHAAVGVLPRARRLPVTASRAAAGISKKHANVDASPFTLAAQHVLATGTERSGLAEIWVHPLCIARDFDLRIDGEPAIAHEFEISPAEIQRTIRTTAGNVFKEQFEPDPKYAAIFWQLVGEGRTKVEITLRVPLALAWPMPTDVLHPRRTEIVEHGTSHVVVVTGRDARHLAAIFVDGFERPEIVEEGRDGPRIRLVSAIATAHSTALSICFTASTTGRLGIPGPATIDAVIERQNSHWKEVVERSARLVTAHPALDEAWQWAVARLSSFMAGSPYHNMRGLMAGYAESREGWGRSRPGYAWFFGRDTCWCVDALLAAGLHEEARDAIALLVHTADVTGKIAHEITASGVVHYDAADATPLLLRAIAAYVEWTADAEQLDKWWSAVEKALDYCVSCDRDGDGIPENTGVGHGWIESGPLGGGTTTSYVAAIWIDALRRLQAVAAATSRDSTAKRIQSMLLTAEAGIERLRDPETGRLALDRSVDGRLTADLTALAAVPVALGVEKPRPADKIVDALADPSFTTPWGLRMLSATDPRYNPRSYHTGSVWPLFTGWAALADARQGRAERALDRVTSIASLVNVGCKGAFDEVLDGDDGSPAGVCADQAWSAAMMISPIVYGLMGVRPNALQREIRIEPSLPHSSSSFSIVGLSVADARLTIVCKRQGNSSILEVEASGGSKALDIVTRNQRLQLGPNERKVVELAENG